MLGWLVVGATEPTGAGASRRSRSNFKLILWGDAYAFHSFYFFLRFRAINHLGIERKGVGVDVCSNNNGIVYDVMEQKKNPLMPFMDDALEYEITRHWCFHSNANGNVVCLDDFGYSHLAKWSEICIRKLSVSIFSCLSCEDRALGLKVGTLPIRNAIYCRDEFNCNFSRFMFDFWRKSEWKNICRNQSIEEIQ